MTVSLSVKNVPERVARALRARAKRHHRSLQGELLAILTSASAPSDASYPSETNVPYARRPIGSIEVRDNAKPLDGEAPAQKSDEFGRLLAAPAITIPDKAIAEFCGRWRVTEFALFGSVLRDDFRPDSDIDVMVRFEPDAPWSLFDLGDMQAELSHIFHRPVDLHEREGVEQSKNWIRRKHILENHRVIYAA